MTSNRKSDKEIAFLQDLFIAPDWGERFAELIDQHIKLPKKGKALYVAAGTGGHALALYERAGEKLELLCVDENPECTELARAKATATGERITFDTAPLDKLTLSDNHFDLVIGNASLVPRQRVKKMFSELVRVAAPARRSHLPFQPSQALANSFRSTGKHYTTTDSSITNRTSSS